MRGKSDDVKKKEIEGVGKGVHSNVDRIVRKFLDRLWEKR